MSSGSPRCDGSHNLMDDNFRIPGTPLRFGWDLVLGLFPGLGDVLTSALSLLIVHHAWQTGASKLTLARMLGNVGVDFVIGAIPLLGDLFDFVWKANRKNALLLEQHLTRQADKARATGPERNYRRGWRVLATPCVHAFFRNIDGGRSHDDETRARAGAASDRVPGLLRLPPLPLLCRRWRLPPRKARPTRSGRGRSRRPSRATSSIAAPSIGSCTDDIVASFVGPATDLALELEFAELEARSRQELSGEDNVGPLSFDTEVAAEPNSVSMDVKDKKFEAGLRNASALNIVAAGATIKVPLDKSTDGLERLEQCVEKNARRSQPTLLWLRHVGRKGRRVGGQRPQLHAGTPECDRRGQAG